LTGDVLSPALRARNARPDSLPANLSLTLRFTSVEETSRSPRRCLHIHSNKKPTVAETGFWFPFAQLIVGQQPSPMRAATTIRLRAERSWGEYYRPPAQRQPLIGDSYLIPATMTAMPQLSAIGFR
jgi:hypothetical protein